MTSINNSIIMALVVLIAAAKRLSLAFALTGWEIEQFECWNNRSLKLRLFVGIQDGLRAHVTTPARLMIERKLGYKVLVIGYTVVRQ